MEMMRMLRVVLLACMLAPLSAQAAPVEEVPDLNYVNVLQALIKLERFKPDNQEFLDGYTMAAHCDVVHGSYRDEFRWAEARKAVQAWLATHKASFPTRLAVKSSIQFGRYDAESKYFLFNQQNQLDRVNTFNTDSRTIDPVCAKPESKLLPSSFRVVTNNPVTLPGLRLTDEQARDLAQKFNMQGNSQRIAYIRFNIDILDADYLGPSVYSKKQAANSVALVKSVLHSIEFFADPQYTQRFYYYTPM